MPFNIVIQMKLWMEKKKWVKKKEEQFHSQKALSGPDAP